jgi:hypothetical protein
MRGRKEEAAGDLIPSSRESVGGGVHLLAGSMARARARTCFQLEEDDDWRSLGRATAGLRRTEGEGVGEWAFSPDRVETIFFTNSFLFYKFFLFSVFKTLHYFECTQELKKNLFRVSKKIFMEPP